MAWGFTHTQYEAAAVYLTAMPDLLLLRKVAMTAVLLGLVGMLYDGHIPHTV